MAETTYCDDYEAIVGPKPEPEAPVVETKVITAPQETPVAPATEAETK